MGLFDGIKFPYLNTQELNLDWIMTKIKELMGFMPSDGNVGDILTRKTTGAEWEPPDAVNININNLPEDTAITDNDQLVFYDISASANRKIKPPNLLDSMMSNGTPYMNGTGNPGTSKKPSRYDHVHPVDTSRQAALNGAQMNAVNSGAPANCFTNGVLNFDNGGINDAGNGFCRMPDGTQICWAETSMPAAGVTTITFPQAFLGYPKVIASWSFGSAVNVSGDIGAIKIADLSSNVATISIGGSIPSDMVGKLKFNWIAIGRWKSV